MRYILIKKESSILNKSNKLAILVKDNGILKGDLSLFQNSTDFDWINKISKLKDRTIYLMVTADFNNYVNINHFDIKIKIKLFNKYFYQIRNKTNIIEEGIKENLYANTKVSIVIDDLFKKNSRFIDSKIIKDIDLFNPRSNNKTKGYLMTYMNNKHNKMSYRGESKILIESTRLYYKDLVKEGEFENL